MKWIAIQPLTGGAYLGAEESIGQPAEFIISFKGLRNISEKNGEPVQVANEHYLDTYLRKHNRLPQVLEFTHGMFDKDISERSDLDYDFGNIDLVIAVPVCSGLCMATSTASSETRDSKNANMKFITHYTISQIKPQIYIFENAPTFMGAKADPLRKWFENLAKEYGYAITYYKTDTCLHGNCQRRPRTFIIFSKGENAIKLNWEKNEINIIDYLANYPKSNYNNDSVKSNPHNYKLLEFIKKEYGNSWRDHVNGNLIMHLYDNDKLEDFREYLGDDERSKKYIDHILYKKSIGKNYYASDFVIQKEKISAVQFRSIPFLIHPIEDRTYTVREYLNFMGMPSDFEWYGNDSNLSKIGQNVPVKTAKFIVDECVSYLNKNRETFDNRFVYQDNTKQKNFIFE